MKKNHATSQKKITQLLQNCINPTIRIGRESLCLPHAGFFCNDPPTILSVTISLLSPKKIMLIVCQTLRPQDFFPDFSPLPLPSFINPLPPLPSHPFPPPPPHQLMPLQQSHPKHRPVCHSSLPTLPQAPPHSTLLCTSLYSTSQQPQLHFLPVCGFLSAAVCCSFPLPWVCGCYCSLLHITALISTPLHSIL